jgi:hypothetical protein
VLATSGRTMLHQTPVCSPASRFSSIVVTICHDP